MTASRILGAARAPASPVADGYVSFDRRLRRVEAAVSALADRVDLLLRRRAARAARDPRIPALPDPPEAREFLPSYRPPQRD